MLSQSGAEQSVCCAARARYRAACHVDRCGGGWYHHSSQMTGRKLTWFDYFGFAMTGASALLAGIVLVFWAHSYQGADTAHIPGPGIGSIDIISDEGRLMIGVFSEDTGRRWWGRSMRSHLSDLQTDPKLHVVVDFWGW